MVRAKKRKGTKVHLAVDTLAHLLTLTTSPANEQDRAQVEALCHRAQERTAGILEVMSTDQSYTGEHAPEAVRKSNIGLVVLKRPDALVNSWCCQNVGWSSVRSRSCRAFVDWAGVWNTSPRP